MLTVHAHAKINLSLEVLGLRPDGYHELISVMQTVSIHDELHLTPDEELAMSCSDPALEGEDNLVMQAARLLKYRYSVPGGCRIRLEKRIPAAAGLGGGSTDAAATLTALSRLWSLDLDCADLMPLAAQLGSDVPFFLHGGTALVEGRGEKVHRLAAEGESWYVLARPALAVSTAEVFRNLSPAYWTNGNVTRALGCEIDQGAPRKPGINGLQETLFRLHPEAVRCYQALQDTAGNAFVSGSGPTVVAMCTSPRQADHFAQTVRGQGFWSISVRSLVPEEVLTPCA